jgi:hypothetical protein
MNKTGLIFAVITLIIFVGGVFLLTKPKNIPAITGYEYYWGNGCPHCKVVDDFVSTWSGKDKIKIDKREVWNNTKNAELMNERANTCNIQRSQMGVPFLVTPEGKCLIGDGPIIEHYKSLNL